GDIRAEAIGTIENLGGRAPLEPADQQRGDKCIARTHRVGRVRSDTGCIVPPAARPKPGTARTTRDAYELRTVALAEMPRELTVLVTADARDEPSRVAEPPEVVRDVRRRAAERAAIRQHVPEQLADAGDSLVGGHCELRMRLFGNRLQ